MKLSQILIAALVSTCVTVTAQSNSTKLCGKVKTKPKTEKSAKTKTKSKTKSEPVICNKPDDQLISRPKEERVCVACGRG